MKKTPRFFECATQPREGARPRAPRRPWTAALPAALPAALLASCFFLLACCGLPAASAADLALDGRWLDAGSNVVANATVPATVNVYTNDAADAVALTNAPVALATDSDGFFRAVATNLSLPAGCRTYWLGVTPQDGTEIAPRMKVSPAPLALHAAEARAIETETLTVEGTVTVGRLTNSTATVGSVAVTDDLAIHAIGGFDQLYLDGIDLTGGGRLALFRKVRSGSLTVSVDAGNFLGGPTPMWTTAPDDGFLFIRMTFSGANAGLCQPGMIFQKMDKGIIDAFANWNDLPVTGPGQDYCLTLPVRGGDRFYIAAYMTRPYSNPFEASWTIDCTFYAAGIE